MVPIYNVIFIHQQDQRTRTRRQVVNDDLDGSIEEPSTRPTRSTRQTPSSSRNNGTAHQDSDDDDSDDDQLLSQIASQNRSKRSPRASVPLTTEFVDTTSPDHLNGLPRTREMIRRKQSAVSLNSTATVTSNQNVHSTRSMTTVETSQIEITRNQVSFGVKSKPNTKSKIFFY